MVVLGGVTRLTESGLSITEWKPVSGVLPPLNESQWREEFTKYQTIPEFKIERPQMTLDEYKTIYWWEYAHRLWGRLIGLAFFLPLVYFFVRGNLHKDWIPPLIIILLLGANQGFLGWYMVESGLSVRTDVSQYRLTAHLTLACLIYAYTLWIALHIRHAAMKLFVPKAKILWPVMAIFALYWMTFIMGGFMAGTNAGLLYQTFPKYNADWWPSGVWILEPWYKNLFENTTAIHAVHRSLAIGLVVGSIAIVPYILKFRPPKSVKIPLFHVAGMGLVQMAIGISTIKHQIPIWLGALHQAGGVLLLTFFIWLLFSLRKAQI